jgi:2'-5' RNA ligase
LTLAFLGEVDDGRLPDLKRFPVLGERHVLPIERAGYWSRNRILWAGPEQAPAQTAALACRLQQLLAERKFRTERRPFAAHVTLLRKAREPQELPSLPEVDWPVQECVLVRSGPAAQGSRYRILERYPLA